MGKPPTRSRGEIEEKLRKIRDHKGIWGTIEKMSNLDHPRVRPRLQPYTFEIMGVDLCAVYNYDLLRALSVHITMHATLQTQFL